MGRRTVREINEEGKLNAELIRLFMARHLRFTGGRWAGRPFVLDPWQYRSIVLPIFGTLDGRGERVYREGIVGLPRWGGKSQIAAGLGLSLVYCEPTYEGEYYVVATTKRQAQIVFDKAKRMVLADPLLRATTKVYRTVLEIPETGALFRVLPWDADTTQGPPPHRLRDRRVPRAQGRLDARGDDQRHGRHEERPADHDLDRRPGAQGAALGAPQVARPRTRAPTSTGAAPATRRTEATPRSGAAPTPRSGSP